MNSLFQKGRQLNRKAQEHLKDPRTKQTGKFSALIVLVVIAFGVCQSPYQWNNGATATATQTNAPTAAPEVTVPAEATLPTKVATEQTQLEEAEKTQLTALLDGMVGAHTWVRPSDTTWNWEIEPQPIFGQKPRSIRGAVKENQAKVEITFLQINPDALKDVTSSNHIFLAGPPIYASLLQTLTQKFGAGVKTTEGNTTYVKFISGEISYLLTFTPRETLKLEVFNSGAESLDIYKAPHIMEVAGHKLSTDQKLVVVVDISGSMGKNPTPSPKEVKAFQKGSFYQKYDGSSIAVFSSYKHIIEQKPQSIIYVNDAEDDFPKPEFALDSEKLKRQTQSFEKLYNDLLKVFTKQGIRLYITTFNGKNPNPLVEKLAKETGGAVITNGEDVILPDQSSAEQIQQDETEKKQLTALLENMVGAHTWARHPEGTWNWETSPQPIFGQKPRSIRGAAKADQAKVEITFLQIKAYAIKDQGSVNHIALAGPKVFPALLQALTQKFGAGVKTGKANTTQVKFTSGEVSYLLTYTVRENLILEIFTTNAELLDIYKTPQ